MMCDITPKETFFLRLQGDLEGFETLLSNFTLPSHCYTKFWADRTPSILCSPIRLWKISSDDGGFMLYLIFAEFRDLSLSFGPLPQFNGIRSPIKFGFIRLKPIGNDLCLVCYQYHNYFIEIFKQLFKIFIDEYHLWIGDDIGMLDYRESVVRLIGNEYQPTLSDLQLLDDQCTLSEFIEKEKENRFKEPNKFQMEITDNQIDSLDRSIEQLLPTSNQTDDKKPWERIPDENWDRKALEMWWNHHDRNEIAHVVHVSPAAVTNRISELRQKYKTEIVPTNNQRRKMRIQKK